MSFEIWKFLTGLGLFLFAMHEMETALKRLTGRAFKLFLKNYTKNTFIAILIGAVITGLVQSSSLVSFMVLAFVETGAMAFQNGLAIILGANVGTTLTGWMIATIGFGFNIEEYAFPIIAFSSIALFFLRNKPNIYNFLKLVFSVGLLFLSISYMKQGAEVMVKEFNINELNHYGKFSFLIAGIIITTLVQSSSATVLITLTALFTNTIDFKSAAALVIGSELGTTVKTALWSLNGSANQKRVGWGNFIFNSFTCIFAFIFLEFIIEFVSNVLGVKTPAIALVTFQTTINLMSLVLFLPFLNLFSKLLASMFGGSEGTSQSYLTGPLTDHPSVAADEYYLEAKQVYSKSLRLHRDLLGIHSESVQSGIMDSIKKIFRDQGTIEVEYERLKHTEGELLEHYSKLNQTEFTAFEWDRIGKSIKSVRELVQATKALKDVAHNFHEFNDSADDIIHSQYSRIQHNWLKFETEITRISKIKVSKTIFTELQKLMHRAYKEYDIMDSYYLTELKRGILNDSEVSTLINVERQIRTSKKSLIRAIANLELEPKQINEFEYSPEF